MSNPILVGKRGVITLPSDVRHRYRIEEGSMLVMEETPQGLLFRTAVAVPVEVYTDDRVRDFVRSDRKGAPRKGRAAPPAGRSEEPGAGAIVRRQKAALREIRGTAEGSGERVGRDHDRYLYGDSRG